MSKCPFCHFENEAGALFCEQCKSDLGWVEPNAVRSIPDPDNGASAPAGSEELAPAAIAEPIHAASVVEEPILAGAIPIAEASPVYALAEPAQEETRNGYRTSPPVDEAIMPPDAAHAASSAHSPPSTLDQVLPPSLGGKIASGSKPRLIVLRGQRQNVEYQIYEGDNYIGRADDKAVDLDLEDQEPPDRIWSSRQHAVIAFEGGSMTIEDLNSTNGTYLNRTRIETGKKIPLSVNDVIQIGTVQLKVVV
jgi:hypothetical protein